MQRSENRCEKGLRREGDWYTSNAVGRKVLTLAPINTFFCIGSLIDDKYQGQARGIWTYHLKKAQYHEGPLFWRPHCGQTSGHTSYFEVSNERYIHYLSHDAPWFNFDWLVWSQRLAKVGCFGHFPENGKKFQALKLIFLDIIFQNAVIWCQNYLEPSNQLQMTTNIS